MDKANNNNKFQELRKNYPYFVFQSYSIFRTKTNLQIKFVFDLAGKYLFQPELEVPFRDFYNLENMPDGEMENLAFHIGMVELVSYWKTACPPKVIVRTGQLDKKQVLWWKKLYFNGLGEFFYLNGIETDIRSFMEIVSEGHAKEVSTAALDDLQVLVPIGGGKDSAVTLELLKNNDLQLRPFLLNPREASIRTIHIAGFSEPDSIIVNRKLDAGLLELNRQGFLNGHTPFSALLAFVTAFTALLSGSRYIALSNESSANESTVPGSDINHQYSKSFEFEQDFNWYLKSYIHPELHYFSFLRPLNELQIAALFSKLPQHHFSFRSCNVGSKTDSWCCQCPKCLFTYVMLSAFLPQQRMEKIFGKNLFRDTALKNIMNQLDGEVEVKPFECVGTPEEVNAALGYFSGSQKEAVKFPLIQNIEDQEENRKADSFRKLLHHLNREHFLPENFLKIIKKNMAHVTL